MEEKTCFYCSNAHCDEDDNLHCVQKNGIIVKDDDTCDEFN